MVAVDTVERRATRTRPALVARGIIVVAEIRAAGALHDVSAHGGHIAQLAGCREQEPLGNHREALAHLQVRCHIAHAGECADAQGAVRSRLDVRHPGQVVDVEQTLGKSGAVFHQTQQVGTAGDERKLAVARVSRDGAMAILEKAYGFHSTSLLLIGADPLFDGLRSDRRFPELLRRIGLFNQISS